MKYLSLALVIALPLLLVGCAKKVEETPLPEETVENTETIENDSQSEIIDSDINAYSSGEDTTSDGLDEDLTEPVNSRENCSGSETNYTCTDPNNGNSYEITKYGNTTEVQGTSLSGSTWSQTSETIGSTTYTTGYDKDSNAWNQTSEKIGDTYYYDGTDSDGNAFSGSCDTYSGCTRN